jgi:hypothetical protein
MSQDDIWEYIKGFVLIRDYYKMSCVSKIFSKEYNVKRLISNNDLKSVYNICGATPSTIIDIINHKVIHRYDYRYNKYIHANITSAIYTDNVFNILMYNGKLEIISLIYALLYSAINQKYKNIINIIDGFKFNYHNHGNNNIDLYTFTQIMHFILNYLKDNYNFKRYSEKTKLLCKLNLSFIIIITVKMEKIKDIDENDKNRAKKVEYNEVINDKIIDIIGSVIEYQYYYPQYFTAFLLKNLNNFHKL